MAHLDYAGRRSTAEAPSHDALIAPSLAVRRAWHWERFVPPLLVAMGLIGWEWGVASGRVSALLFPAPSTITATLWRLLTQDALLLDVGATLYRMGLGLLIGASVGITLGLLMGWSARVRTLTEPFIAALHPIPKSALLPLLLVLMGLGDGPRVTLVSLAAFFPMLINTMHSVKGLDPALLEAAHNYGARGHSLFRRVILPATLPDILSGLRIAANAAMTIAITAELLTARVGLGGRIWMAWQTMRTENLYATLIIIALLGLGLNWSIARLARWLMPWSPQATAIEK